MNNLGRETIITATSNIKSRSSGAALCLYAVSSTAYASVAGSEEQVVIKAASLLPRPANH